MQFNYKKSKLNISILLMLSAMLFVNISVQAQVPPSFMIQGLAQDADGLPLVSQDVSVAVTLDGVELEHEPVVTTSSAGVFKLEVTSFDIFDLLSAGGGFLEVTVEGIPLVTPLLSVPYAMIAEQVVNDQVDDEDADSTNELQELSFSDGMLSISGGNEIAIPTGTTDADADPTNELQTLAFSNGKLSITDGNEIDLPTGGADADADPTNELQTLSFADGKLSISDGNEITIPTGGTDADADPTNELQQLSLNGNVLSIVNPGQGADEITLPNAGGGDSPWTKSGNDVSYSDGQVIVRHSNTNSVVMDADRENGSLKIYDDQNRVVAQLISDGTRNDNDGSFGYLELSGPNSNPNVILGFVGNNSNQDRGGVGIYNEGNQAWWLSPGSSNDPDLGLYYLNGNNFNVVGEFSRTNGTYTALSDRRAKSGIEELPSLLDKVNMLRPVSYFYKHDSTKKNDVGFIAQDVKDLFPSLVNKIEDRYGLNYSGFSVLAIKAVQELSAENEELQNQLAEQSQFLDQQDSLIKDLIERIEKLEQANK